MAAKLIVLLMAGAALADAQEPCTCEDEKTLKEATDIFKFLNRLSSDAETAEDERLPTLPALLSPLVPCGNCVENNRKKRKIFPDASTSEEIVKHEHTKMREEERRRDRNHFHEHGARNKCPFGYTRIGFMCVNTALL